MLTFINFAEHTFNTLEIYTKMYIWCKLYQLWYLC